MTLMFRMLVLQALYKLSEDQSEFQVRDRRSFQRFLALSAEATVPEAKTLWLFCERLVGHGLINKRFQRFEEPLWLSGLVPKGAQITDAIVHDSQLDAVLEEENSARSVLTQPIAARHGRHSFGSRVTRAGFIAREAANGN